MMLSSALRIICLLAFAMRWADPLSSSQPSPVARSPRLTPCSPEFKGRSTHRRIPKPINKRLHNYRVYRVTTTSIMAQRVSQQEAQTAIDKVVQALRKDNAAISELGKLEKVTVILGFGSPRSDAIAVRFNAQFKRTGMGRSSVPLPFGLGQSNVSEGRGTMVGQVKASVHTQSGKVIECAVFRDLGYGRSFQMKL